MIMPGTDRCSLCGQEYQTGCVRQFPNLCEDCRESEDLYEKVVGQKKPDVNTLKKVMEAIIEAAEDAEEINTGK